MFFSVLSLRWGRKFQSCYCLWLQTFSFACGKPHALQGRAEQLVFPALPGAQPPDEGNVCTRSSRVRARRRRVSVMGMCVRVKLES